MSDIHSYFAIRVPAAEKAVWQGREYALNGRTRASSRRGGLHAFRLLNRLLDIDGRRRYNNNMFHRIPITVCAVLAAVSLSVAPLSLHAQDDSHHGRKYKAPPPAAHIEVTVLKDFNGKPIPDAHVIFHPTEGDKDKGSLELKTNDDGQAVIDVIPIGDTVTLQVIADGYQTYGESYKVEKSDITMEVRMRRPGSQYSIYKKTNSGSNSGSGSSNSGNGSGSSQNSNQSAQPK